MFSLFLFFSLSLFLLFSFLVVYMLFVNIVFSKKKNVLFLSVSSSFFKRNIIIFVPILFSFFVSFYLFPPPCPFFAFHPKKVYVAFPLFFFLVCILSEQKFFSLSLVLFPF